MTIRLRVLGCSGGIGGELRTTSLLVDDDILIDAGTGAADLSLDELAAIDHVFLTHSHLDHIAALPLMVDAVGERRREPLTVYASAELIAALRAHIFNWAIWPDFSAIPSAERPYLRFRSIEVGEPVVLGGRRITAMPAEHTVPAVGYHLDSGEGSLVFSGDTAACAAFWQAVNTIERLEHLIVECAFPDSGAQLARLSKHLCPQLLATELGKLERQCSIHVTHLKPGQAELIMDELRGCLAGFRPAMLRIGTVLEF